MENGTVHEQENLIACVRHVVLQSAVTSLALGLLSAGFFAIDGLSFTAGFSFGAG